MPNADARIRKANAFLELIHSRATAIAKAFTWLGGAALLGCAILITFDIISRKTLGYSIAGTDEITGYVFSVATAWALSYCVLARANIRIDAAYRLFGPAMRAVLDILSTFLLLIFAAVILKGAVGALSETLVRGTISTTGMSVPIWIPQSFWVIGILMLVASLVLQLFHSLFLAVQGNWSGISRVAGIPSNEAQIDVERGVI